jgi:hypothetical protein
MIDVIVFSMALIMVLVMLQAILSKGAGIQHFKRYGRYIMLERAAYKENGYPTSCIYCAHHYHYTGPMGHRCYGRKRRVDNLRSFPFKTPQRCFKYKKMISIYDLGDL